MKPSRPLFAAAAALFTACFPVEQAEPILDAGTTRYDAGPGSDSALDASESPDSAAEQDASTTRDAATAPDMWLEQDAGDPVCGDGLPHPDETSDSCCVDINCEDGVCDADAMQCVDPWLLVCPTRTNQCADALPWRCDSDSTPSYDCGRCGCASGQTCQEDHCFDDTTLTLEHGYEPTPSDLPLDEYFAFFDAVMSRPALTYAEFVAHLELLLREDARRSALLLGESHSSDDEQAVAVQLLRDVQAAGWSLPAIGIEGAADAPILDPEMISDLQIPHHAVTGDLTNTVHCADATSEVGQQLNDQGIYVQYSGSGHTSQEICHHPRLWAICDLPHTAECLLSEGRMAVTVIHLDPHVWLWVTDRLLLWRLADSFPEEAQIAADLSAVLARWDVTMANQIAAPDFDVTANGLEVNVRLIEAQHASDVFFAYFPRPGRDAYMLRAWKAAFDDQTLRAFMLAHDIRPTNCSISWDLTPGAEVFSLWCGNGDYEYTATVDGTSYTVVDSQTIMP